MHVYHRKFLLLLLFGIKSTTLVLILDSLAITYNVHRPDNFILVLHYACIPQEIPASVIIWDKVNHTTTCFILLGNCTVHHLDDFVLVPQLDQSSDILQHPQNRPIGDRWLKFQNTTIQIIKQNCKLDISK